MIEPEKPVKMCEVPVDDVWDDPKELERIQGMTLDEVLDYARSKVDNRGM